MSRAKSITFFTRLSIPSEEIFLSVFQIFLSRRNYEDYKYTLTYLARDTVYIHTCVSILIESFSRKKIIIFLSFSISQTHTNRVKKKNIRKFSLMCMPDTSSKDHIIRFINTNITQKSEFMGEIFHLTRGSSSSWKMCVILLYSINRHHNFFECDSIKKNFFLRAVKNLRVRVSFI